jgi:16S rRNA (adenine1518-N6/adenine1519-N6)-dimethyltransferase
LAQAQHAPELIVATLQLEVAKRLMATPGHKDYGVLTLLVHLEYEPKGFFKIPASCFFPEPDIDSACVCLIRRVPRLLAPEQKPVFTGVVKRAFSQRRKIMLKLLKEEWPANKLEQIFEQLMLPAHSRAETVSLEQFVRLTEFLRRDSNDG